MISYNIIMYGEINDLVSYRIGLYSSIKISGSSYDKSEKYKLKYPKNKIRVKNIK